MKSLGDVIGGLQSTNSISLVSQWCNTSAIHPHIPTAIMHACATSVHIILLGTEGNG